jgi:hypothetical protein
LFGSLGCEVFWRTIYGLVSLLPIAGKLVGDTFVDTPVPAVGLVARK